MLTSREINNCPRDDHPLQENLTTQPLKGQPVFNNTKVLTEGWYPICASKKLINGQAKSFTILNQRIVVFRSQSNKITALDSFCPHLGADLGNGEVIGENLRCFYHHWSFNAAGERIVPSCSQTKAAHKKDQLNAYPTTEQYGFIWVYGGKTAKHKLVLPPGLEGPVSALHLKKVKLFAHHHVMMTNAIDLQHFKSVHDLAIDFNYEIQNQENGVFSWKLEGEIPTTSTKLRLAHYLLGGKFRYNVVFAGGTITSITYGVGQKFKGNGFKLPSIHILWGATPLKQGVSAVDIFFVIKKYSGALGPLKRMAMYFFSFVLLAILNDDDIKAFPHMRYNIGHLTEEDASLAKFVQLTNKLDISPWSNHE